MKQWQQPGFFFGEETFLDEMNTKGKQFRDEHYAEGDFPGCDFRTIHYTMIKHPNEKAVIVISHGFCEFISKYDELIYYFYQLGYSVYFMDHRGHGHSFRYITDELDRVHAIDFEEYVDDLRCFVDTIVRKESPNVKMLLFAHSMGGAIGARMLERYPDYFDAAILSSPMMQMDVGKFPEWLVRFLAGWMKFVGKDKRYVPGSHGFEGKYEYEKSSAQSKARYEYVLNKRKEVPEFTMWGATYGWTGACLKGQKKIRRDAHKVQIPVLLFSAGKDTKVKPEGQAYFAAHSGNTTVIEYPDSKHEIFNAFEKDREAYLADVFTFFEKAGEES